MLNLFSYSSVKLVIEPTSRSFGGLVGVLAFFGGGRLKPRVMRRVLRLAAISLFGLIVTVVLGGVLHSASRIAQSELEQPLYRRTVREKARPLRAPN